MATTTRRRKPAPADSATFDLLDAGPEASTAPVPTDPPAAESEAAPEATLPAKRPRAPRKRTAKAAELPLEDAASEVLAAEPATAEEAAVSGEAPPPAPKAKRRGGRAAAPDVQEPEALAAAEPAADVPPAGEPAEPEAEAPAPVEVEPLPFIEPLEPVEPEQAPEPAPPVRETSQLTLEEGLQRRVCWQAGSRCPGTLSQAVQRWQAQRGASELAFGHLDELSELLAIAARTGHTVEVDEAVWSHLARLSDLQGRIAHLESRHPQGLDPAAQPEGSLLAGWRACQLEAAFFAACVGRCVLADEPALEPENELLLAARLVMQHFGTGAPVVLAPADAHAGWQAAWSRVWPADAPAGPPALVVLSPGEAVPEGTELLLLDQRQRPDVAATEAPASQAAAWLWVLAPHDLLERPEALPLFTAVDQLRQGGLATWQAEGNVDALAAVLLARRFADVASQWPAWAPTVRTTATPVGEASLRDELAQRLARWQRSGFLADSDQLALRRTVASLWAAARAANIAALPALLGDALSGGAGRIVVFSEDAALLPELAATLQATGLPVEALPAAGSPRLAEQALRAFREAEGPRILLVADGPEGAEQRIGVQLAAPIVIHLDTPWHADALARRLQRVRPGGSQREVPVWQLLPEASLMARRAQSLPVDAGAGTRLSGALLRGPVLEAWLQELAALL
ncbi:hypothetical protein [Ideonella sp. YS5]|uniref:hypothetical protein n=1 Tax=Ideonella sp. YS5 TaxID=3453714 RepID=UPI003EEF9237